MSTEVKTYTHRTVTEGNVSYSEMIETYLGKWVKVEDFDASQAQIAELKGVLDLKNDDYVRQVGTWKIIQRLEEEVAELKAKLESYELRFSTIADKIMYGFDKDSVYKIAIEPLDHKSIMEENEAYFTSLESELKEARGVVVWYGDKKNWVSIRDRTSPSGFFYSCTDDSDEEPFNKNDEDDERVIGGKLARAYLLKYPSEG